MTSLINVLGNHLATGPGAAAARQCASEHRPVPGVRGRAMATSSSRSATTPSSRRLLGVLDLDDADGRFATNRAAGRPPATSSRRGSGTRSQVGSGPLVGALSDADVPAGPVNTVPEALAAMGPAGSRSSMAFTSRRARSASTASSRRCAGHRPAWASTPTRCSPSSSEGVERETGIEPATCSLEGCRSAN